MTRVRALMEAWFAPLQGAFPHYGQSSPRPGRAGWVLDCCSKVLFGLGLAFFLSRWPKGLATGEGILGVLYLFSALRGGTISWLKRNWCSPCSLMYFTS